jgi:hypothetical protein
MPSRRVACQAFCLSFDEEIYIITAKIPRGPAMNVYHKRPEADPEIVRIRKERQCLLCLVPFESEWSGERICQKCKSRSVWREGHS